MALSVSVQNGDGSRRVDVKFVQPFLFLHHVCSVTPITLQPGEKLTVNWIGTAEIIVEDGVFGRRPKVVDTQEFSFSHTYTFKEQKTFRFIEFKRYQDKFGGFIHRINVYEEDPKL